MQFYLSIHSRWNVQGRVKSIRQVCGMMSVHAKGTWQKQREEHLGYSRVVAGRGVLNLKALAVDRGAIEGSISWTLWLCFLSGFVISSRVWLY